MLQRVLHFLLSIPYNFAITLEFLFTSLYYRLVGETFMGRISRTEDNMFDLPKGAFLRNGVYVYVNTSNRYISFKSWYDVDHIFYFITII